MTPTLIHRYQIPAVDAARALIDFGDCREVRVSLEAGVMVVDVVDPVQSIAPTEADVTLMASNEVARINTAPAEPERKGGPIAQRAGIICGERSFQVFVGKWVEEYQGQPLSCTDDAASWLRRHCGIDSRADLDHDDRAAAIFHEVEQTYRLWMDGYDV